MSEAVISSPELDYSTLVSSHGSYKISRVRPLDQDSQDLLQNATIESQIELPTGSKVINFAKSSLTFKLKKVAETGASVLHSNALPIDRIVCYDKGGQYLAELNGFDDLHRAISPYVTKLSEFQGNPTGRGSLAGDRNEKGFCNFPSSAAPAATCPAYGKSGARISHTKAAPTVGVPEADDVPYWGQQHLVTNDAASDMYVEYCVPLKQFYHTLLAQNRDLFFGSNIMLSIHWAPVRRLGYQSTAGGAPNDLIQDAEFATGATVSNIQLKLAVETNPEVVGFLVNAVRSSGVSTKIPFVRRYQFVNNQGELVNNQIRLNRRNGMRLLNVYSMLFNPATTGVLAHNLSNVHGEGLSAADRQTKEVSFQSAMNNNQLQEYRVNSNGEDFEILKSRGIIDGCVIASQNDYQHNRIWIDSWRSGASCSWPERDGDIDGYDLNEEAVLVMDKTVVDGTYRHVMYAVTLRELSIAPNGLITIA